MFDEIVNGIKFKRGMEPVFTLEITGVTAAMEVVNFSAYERISEPFVLEAKLAGRDEIKSEEVIGKDAVLTISGGEVDRYFHGAVRKFEQVGRSGRKYLYRVEVVSFLHLLSLQRDCRIFQDLNVQDIIAQIFKESAIKTDDYEFRLTNKDHRRRYCVQYRETDMDFIVRLLQEEGIFYYFEHSEKGYMMVFGDAPTCHKAIEGNQEVIFMAGGSGMNANKEHVSSIALSRRLRPGKFVHTNFNFKIPSAALETKDMCKDKELQKYEIYDYPGQYGNGDRGNKLAKAQLQAAQALAEQVEGTSDCPRLAAGCTFTLSDHDFRSFNKEYLIIETSHMGEQTQVLEEQADEGGTVYFNRFTAIPYSVPFRPIKTIKKPLINSIQSAVVVGPQGEEIYTDRYGRVKVQFHWDRKGKKDDKSSCWLRCAQGWGGNGWGMVFLPRIGDEVLVAFMDGDPDWPVIVGSVYNGDRNPLYSLPDHKTRSTIRTRSYPNSSGFNELRFEDKAGSEEIFLHGEKDWNIVIKNDKGQSVGHDETLNVANNRTKTVGVNQSETIGANKTINVGANHTESIGANKTETVNINSAETIGAAKELNIGGAYLVNVGAAMNEFVLGGKAEEVGLVKAVAVGADMKEHVVGDRDASVGKEFSINAGDRFTITCGNASICLNKDGSIQVNGSSIELGASGEVKINGKVVKLN